MNTNDETSDSERMRKLFLGGLSFSTTEDDIREAFQEYGTIVDCVVIRDPSRRDDPTPSRSRGFGFVTFQAADETNAVLEARKRKKIKMNGREIDIKRAMAREDSEKDPTVNEETKKIYIYGIGSLREDDLKDYFNGHGEVVNVIIPKQNADPSKIRGFAFVEFSDFDIVDTLVAMKTHTIGGVSLEVKKATPQTKGGRDRGGGMGDRQRGGFDSGFGGGSAFGQRGYGGASYGGGNPYGGGHGYGGVGGAYGGASYGAAGSRGFTEERYAGGRMPRDNYGGSGGFSDGYGRGGGYDDGYSASGGYSNRGFGGSAGGYRGDSFGGGYGSGSFGSTGNYNRYGGGGGGAGGGGRRY